LKPLRIDRQQRLVAALKEAASSLKKAQAAADVGDIFVVKEHLNETEGWIAIAKKVIKEEEER